MIEVHNNNIQWTLRTKESEMTIKCKKCHAVVKADGILIVCPECGALDWQ